MAPARSNVQPSTRSTDKLLTLDRGLLIGIFGIGVWVATNTAIRDDLVKKVDADAQDLRGQRATLSQLQIDNAVLKTRLDQIAEDISRTAAAVEKLSRK
jgi:hypothetical protein